MSSVLLPSRLQTNSNICLDFAQIFQCHSYLVRNQVKNVPYQKECLIVSYK